MGSPDAAARIADLAARLLRSLPEDPAFVPSPIQGSISGEGAEPRRALAVAVNGRVAAVCRTFGDTGTRFSALVPEDAFRPGANRIDLYWIDEGPAGLELRPLSVA